MALPTVNDILADAAARLGDPDQGEFTNAGLHPFFRIAWSEMWDCMLNNGLQSVDRETTYTLPANTLTLTPATASISDMGEPTKLWERPSGSSANYSPMSPADELPQVSAGDSLGYWKWEGDTFWFVGATGARQLKIEYTASSAPPAIGATTTVDGSRSFLATRTASLIAPSRGMAGLGQQLAREALGPELEANARGGLLRQLINPMIRESQKRATSPQRFRPRRNYGY
jgi:hypothetical protein